MEQKDLEKIVQIILANDNYTKEELTRLIIELIRAVEKPQTIIDRTYYPSYPYNPIIYPSITWQDTTKPLCDWNKVTCSTDLGTVPGFDSVRETKNKQGETK